MPDDPYEVDPASLHSGEPVLRGEKWMLGVHFHGGDVRSQELYCPGKLSHAMLHKPVEDGMLILHRHVVQHG